MIRTFWSLCVSLGIEDVVRVGVAPVCAQAQNSPAVKPRGVWFVLSVVRSRGVVIRFLVGVISAPYVE